MRQELIVYEKLMHFLAETMGSTFEAGLFDLTDPSFPSVAETNANGDALERIREVVLDAINSTKMQSGDYLTNYPIQNDFDKLLKVSVFFIRDQEEKIIGALWLSMRCDLFLKMERFAMSMLRFHTEDLNTPTAAETTGIARELSLDTITEVIREFGDTPSRMTLAERQEVICDLYDTGVYNLRGAVAKTAEIMQISEQSVYRYIAKIKKARDW